MPNFKNHNQQQGIFVPINFKDQFITGTFEHAINHIIDNHIDISVFYHRYKNHEKGASAYHPRVMLKIILFAYSKGIFKSRKIEKLCKNNTIFIALSGDAHPDHSSIAGFVCSMEKEIKVLYTDILLLCAQLNLIGGEIFAMDGCKISSNASKECSGTFKELDSKKQRLHKTIVKLIKKHKAKDKQEREKEKEDFENKIAMYNKRIKKLESFIDNNKPKKGKRGKELKSNTTDNDSAKMTSSHGTIQGYDGIVLTDKSHQIIMEAQAFGSVNEGEHLKEVIEGARENVKKAKLKKSFLQNKILTADTNYFTEDNLKYLKKQKIDAYIPDKEFRKRDPRFPDKNKYRHYKNLFNKEDFIYDKKHNRYICPNGKYLNPEGKCQRHGYLGRLYSANKNDCQNCLLKVKCLQKNAKRRTIFFTEKKPRRTYSVKMKEKIDTETGRDIYSQRMGIVEPVFANITVNKRLNYFTLRGKVKVNIQWKLYCMVHNIEKIAHYRSDKLKKAG